MRSRREQGARGRQRRGCSLRERLRRAGRKVAEFVRAIDREDMPVLCGLAGWACVVRGVALVHEPAAWITGGVLLLAFYARRS